MLSVTQRARLLSAMPTTLADQTIKVLWKDRFGNDDFVFPTMRVNIISQGVRVNPSTNAPIRKNYDGYQGDVIQYLGQYQQATISLSMMVESETAGTDQVTPVLLDEILYDLQLEIEIYRLGLYWTNDYMKVIPGSGRITYLPPFQAKGADEHWIYPAVFDFKIEYEFSTLDLTPNIHVIGYEWDLDAISDNFNVESPEQVLELTDYHAPWYGMGLSLLGWKSAVSFDMILWSTSKQKDLGMDVILIAD